MRRGGVRYAERPTAAPCWRTGTHETGAFLDGLGWIASAQKRSLRAARLLGAAEGLNEAKGASPAAHLPGFQGSHDTAVAAALAELGEPAFAAAWAAGRATPLQQILDEALADEHVIANIGLADGEVTVHPTPTPLTSREYEIAALIARGLSNRPIVAESRYLA